MLLPPVFQSQENNYTNEGGPKCSPLQAEKRRESSVRPNSVISYPGVATGEMNVTNPRYATQYGNHFLRDSSSMFEPSFPLHTSPIVSKSQYSPIFQKQDSSHGGLNTQVPNISPPPYQPQPSPHHHHPLGGVVPAHFIQTQDKLHNSRVATHV